MVASVLEVLVGGLGLLRPLLRFVGPVTIGPTIGLIGLSMFRIPVIYAAYNPAIALGYVLI
jgi:nucleobase transporter 1/2